MKLHTPTEVLKDISATFSPHVKLLQMLYCVMTVRRDADKQIKREQWPRHGENDRKTQSTLQERQAGQYIYIERQPGTNSPCWQSADRIIRWNNGRWMRLFGIFKVSPARYACTKMQCQLLYHSDVKHWHGSWSSSQTYFTMPTTAAMTN